MRFLDFGQLRISLDVTRRNISDALPARVPPKKQVPVEPAPKLKPAGATEILSMQPAPLSTRCTRFRDSGGQWITSISRVFAVQEVARCRLCQQCAACPRTGQCLISFFEFVPDDQLKYKRKDTL